MKKVLIVAGLIIAGIVTGGGIAYWKYSSDSVIVQKNEVENTEVSQKELPEAKSIEEYKLEFSKDKKYRENCLGDKPIDYSMFDVKDINAANQAVACYQLKYDKKRGTKEAEKDYLEFVDFGHDFTKTHFLDMEKKYSTVVAKDSFNISSVKIIEELLDRIFYKYGLKATYGELEFYPEISKLYVYENIAPYLSEEWQVFLESQTNFEHPITTFHGYFRITKCELSDIVQYYKEFNKEYPEFSKDRGIPNRIIYYEKALKNIP